MGSTSDVQHRLSPQARTLEPDVRVHRPLPRRSGDPGLFGPGSVSWRVHGDPLMAVGGLRALLLQSLHPVVAQGFDSHSNYRDNAWPRLLRTADFVALTTFGSVDRVDRAAAYVRRAHAGRAFLDPRTGREHRLDDPDLLLWVHCCLVGSMLAVTTRGGLDLDADEADRFVAEQVRAGALLGMDAAGAPVSTAELADYLEEMQPELYLTAEARDAVAIVLAPPIHPVLELLTPARIGWSSLAALAFATLPSWARALFPAPMASATGVLPQVAVTGALRTLRRTGRGVQTIVPVLRRSPHETDALRRLGML